MKAGKRSSSGRIDSWILIGFLSALVAVTMSPATARQTNGSATQSREYIGVTGYWHSINLCEDWPGGNPNIGVACFDRTPGRFVKITIEDVSGLPVAGGVVFLVDGSWSYGPRICGESVMIPVEPNWERMYVFIAGPAEAAYGCLAGAGPGTKGVVTATFTSR